MYTLCKGNLTKEIQVTQQTFVNKVIDNHYFLSRLMLGKLAAIFEWIEISNGFEISFFCQDSLQIGVNRWGITCFSCLLKSPMFGTWTKLPNNEK